ncbi:hypothetical protein PIB30_075747 [Stylosanthes scabra]|uniref:Uncharacterized protein n=1 Tax=Stylosanthes scabra TaxID=79078 RepID=A0ABU6VPK4_9FABA|nr:hypothetical protein [Stylosanthes scabra]
MGSAIAAHTRGRRSGNRRSSQNWQGEVACVKQESKDAEPEVSNYRMHFRPRADMGLDVEATRLAVYIYAFIGDPRHDIHDLTRDDLLSLRPRLTPSAIVFVPIWDIDEAWYMMILDMRKPRVYSLDLHRTMENMARKEKQIKAVLRALSLMFAMPTHILNFTYRSPDTSGRGRILQALGIPEDLTCSCLIPGDEDTLRMRLASSIVGAHCNELRPAIDEASQATWQAFFRAKLPL